MKYDVLASQAAGRLGVHRTTLVSAIKSGACAGEERDGRWYTSDEAAAAWYAAAYKHRGAMYSQAAGRAWSVDEVNQLRQMLSEGRTSADIAAALKRAETAVRVMASRLRSAGKAPPAAEVKAVRAKQVAIAEARELLARESPPPRDPYQERRQQERDGRVRLHLHPEVKRRLGEAARRAGLTLAVFVTRAGLAAVAQPEILEQGLRESKKIGIDEASPQGVD